MSSFSTDKMSSFSSHQVSLADEVLQTLVQHMDEAGNDFIDNICRVELNDCFVLKWFIHF
jgi:hypothetical protein